MNIFREIQKTYKISRIYYPGCRHCTVLEKGFNRKQIVNLDKDSWIRRRGIVIGDYKQPPFADSTFDAVFIKDIHLANAPKSRMPGILRVLRPKGIVIFSHDDCSYGTRDFKCLKRQDELEERSNFMFNHSSVTIFQKTR